MSSISMQRAHHLPHDAAIAAANRIVSGLVQKYGIRSEWRGDVMHIDGSGVKGTLEVTPDQVAINLSLGMLAAMFRSTIVDSIEEKFAEVFGKA
jgi:putative polyhydroxyalkanoate system protein